MKAVKLKQIPTFKSDEAAERFVENADLSEYDLSGFRPMHFEIEKKSASLNMRMPQKLLEAVKVKAERKGIPYTRYIRMLIEQDVSR
jgi:predicted DNA binding CopG/RHH family protein